MVLKRIQSIKELLKNKPKDVSTILFLYRLPLILKRCLCCVYRQQCCRHIQLSRFHNIAQRNLACKNNQYIYISFRYKKCFALLTSSTSVYCDVHGIIFHIMTSQIHSYYVWTTTTFYVRGQFRKYANNSSI